MTTLVFDNTALNHFAKAGRLAELRTIVEGYQCVAPAKVFSELARAVAVVVKASSTRWMTAVK